MFERIVVAADGSRPSQAALELAGRLAVMVGGRLLLVAVVEEPPPYVSARREELSELVDARRFFEDELRSAAARLRRRSVAVETEVRVGNEVQALLEAVARFDADLLAVGHAGHSGVWGTRLGATAARLLDLSPASVLVARTADASASVSRILVGYDASPGARRALEAASILAEGLRARLVVGAPNELLTSRDTRIAVPALLSRSARGSETPVEKIDGEPGRGLVGFAQRLGGAMIVVGATGQSHPWATTVGPTAAYVAEHAAGPVLVVASGTRSLTVRRVMRREVVTVTVDTPLTVAVRQLVLMGVKTLPVTDEDHRLVGIITLGDLMRRARLSLRPSVLGETDDDELEQALRRVVPTRITCGAIMTRDPITIGPEAPISRLLEMVSRHAISRLPVVSDDGQLLGIVSRADTLRAVAGAEAGTGAMAPTRARGQTAGDVMRTDVPTVTSTHPLEATARLVMGSPEGRVAVVDEHARIVGVIAVRDLLPLATGEARPRALETVLAPAGRIESFVAGLRSHPERTTAAEIMRREVVTVEPALPLPDLLRLFILRSLKAVLVAGADQSLLGIAHRRDVLLALAPSVTVTETPVQPASGSGWDASQLLPSRSQRQGGDDDVT